MKAAFRAYFTAGRFHSFLPVTFHENKITVKMLRKSFCPESLFLSFRNNVLF